MGLGLTKGRICLVDPDCYKNYLAVSINWGWGPSKVI